ncbi:MAG TPA: deoxyribonuclease IV [bacterium]|uniref:Probable endonuclease 4 n=1 Tax=candidate division TA06 bacterium ADurb.Bin417 TaxID=1852828 RepID=A0A1V5MHW7_UNCT6|nr:MAG: putative endonuclease 4 [candidate division TA06 bacterium ADurb.Bin417]HNQ35199.1 deoxyribonuclease IV [bacterium]HNS48420.1 deoxyribonuclease IV [bacterium]
MKFGVHLATAGRLTSVFENARELSCDTIQIFSRNPRGWFARPLSATEASDFKSARAAASISPLVVHAPYLINLAAPDPDIFDKSVRSCRQELERCALLGADYFVLHPGSHRGEGLEAGIARAAGALHSILKETDSRVLLLLENTAGSGYSLGGRLEELAALMGDNPAIGFCFDTAHALAAGYDIAREPGLSSFLNSVDRLFGPGRMRLVHANDSRGGPGSRLDRHADIGEGCIGLEGFARIVNHQRLQALPFILETPKEDLETDRRNLNTIRSLVK